jgi:hypothetical protein
MASTFRFRVYLEDGTDLDDYVTTAGTWRPGDTLYAGGLPAYRITKVIPVGNVDNELYQGIWEVEPIRPLLEAREVPGSSVRGPARLRVTRGGRPV